MKTLTKIFLVIVTMFYIGISDIHAGIEPDYLGMAMGEADTIIYNTKTHEYNLLQFYDVPGLYTLLLSIPREIVEIYDRGQEDIIFARDLIDSGLPDSVAYGRKLMIHGEREMIIANILFQNYLLEMDMNIVDEDDSEEEDGEIVK